MTVRTRQSYMDLCRSDRPWKGRDMADLVDKIYDVEERADRASKVNATKLVQAKADGFDVAGEGFLQKREGKWILSEPEFLTEEEANKIYARIRHSHNEYALRRHAPTHHYGGADPLEGQSIHGLRVVDRPTFASVTVDPAAAIPTRKTGQIFWDADNHTISAHLEGTSTTGQFFMEQLIYGQNDSGGVHQNGTVGYIKGSQGQRPKIDTARADDRVKSLAIVFSTDSAIANNNSGYYTVRGMTRDIPTSVVPEGQVPWLQIDGNYGPNKPPPSINNRNVSLGTVIRSHGTTGSVLVDIKCFPFIDELSGVGVSGLKDGHQITFNGEYWQNQPSRLHRWPINPDLSYNFTLSYSTINRRPTQTPTGSIFYCWMNGERLTFTGSQALPQHPNVTAQYFYYVDSDGAYKYNTIGFDLFTMVPVCIVEWDAAKGDGWCRPELHTTEVTPLWHQREHDVDGSEIAARSGFSISGYTYNLDTVAGVTFGISGGILWDEDARSVIAALSDGSTYSMFYKAGASGAWTWDEGMALPYKQGTTYPTVNAYTGGTWTQTEVDGTGAAVYFNTFVIVAPCVNKTQIILVQGQGVFASQALAEAQTWDSLDVSGLMWKEFVAIYQVVYKSQAAWSAATKKTEMALAKKITRGSGSSGVGASNEHNALTLRDALDAHPALSITDIYALSVGSILKRSTLGIVAAVPNTDYSTAHNHPYLPINNPEYTGGLYGAGSHVWRSAGINSFSIMGNSVDFIVRDLYDDGSLRDYPLVINRGAGGAIRIGYSGGVRPVELGGQVTNHYLAGIGVRPMVASSSGVHQTQDAATFRGTISAAAAVHDHTSITGSAAKLTTPRNIGMTGDGSWSVSFDGSANVSGAMTLASIITASGPIGSSTRTPVITHDAKGRLTVVTDALITPAWSNIASKPTTFAGLGVTMLASDIPNHASRHHWDGVDPLAGQSIAGLRATSSPTFLEVTATGQMFTSWLNLSESGRINGIMGSNDAWRIYGRYNATDDGYLEIATSDNGNEPIIFRQYTGVSGSFDTIVRELSILDASGNSIFPGRIESSAVWAPSIRLTGAVAGMVRTDSNGYLSVGAMSASELPNHASRHEYGGADALSGQNISGLRTSDSPTFSSLQLSATGSVSFGSAAVGVNGLSEVYIRDVGGSVRVTVSPANTTFSHQIVALSARVANLTTGFVKSDGSGNLTNGSIIATDLPNHASRHEYGGADSLAGQSISGLRTVDSPSFLNLFLDGALRFTGYNVLSYDGDGFFVENSGGDQLLKMTVADGAIIGYGCHPDVQGRELGRAGQRWNVRSNDLNHDLETLTAINTTPGASILSIPSTGNGFRLVNGSDGSTRNYRVPNGPGSGIMKRIVLFSASIDPTGFTRIYPPSSGQLWNGGAQVTTYMEFGSSAGALKIVMDSDGSNWYI